MTSRRNLLWLTLTIVTSIFFFIAPFQTASLIDQASFGDRDAVSLLDISRFAVQGTYFSNVISDRITSLLAFSVFLPILSMLIALLVNGKIVRRWWLMIMSFCTSIGCLYIAALLLAPLAMRLVPFAQAYEYQPMPNILGFLLLGWMVVWVVKPIVWVARIKT